MARRLTKDKSLYVFTGLALFILAIAIFSYYNQDDNLLKNAGTKTVGIELIVIPLVSLMLGGLLVFFFKNGEVDTTANEQYCDAIFSCGNDHLIAGWDTGAASLFGYSTAEALGKTPGALGILPISEGAFADIGKQVNVTGSWNGIFECYHKNNTSFSGAITARLVASEKGENTSLCFCIKNLSESNHSDHQHNHYNDTVEQRVTDRTTVIDASEKKYRYLFENNPMPMWVMDTRSFKFLDVNEMAIIHYGYSREEFLSMTALDIREEKEKQLFLQTAHSLESSPYDSGRKVWNHLKKDGSVIQVEISAHQISFENSNARLILANDVTERIKTANRLVLSEKRFRALTENNNDIITLLDAGFRVFYRSPSAARITGWSDEEMMVSDGYNKITIHPEDYEMSDRVMKECLANPGEPVHVKYRNLHKAGHYLWLEGTITNLLAEENIGAVVFNLRDITERKNAEKKLLAGERRFKALTDNSRDIVSLVDASLQFNYRSPSAARITGWSDEEIKDAGLRAFIHPDEMEMIQALLQKVLLSPGITFDIMSRFLHKDGHYLWMEGTVTNLLQDEDVQSIVINSRDVTERIASAAKLEKSEERFRHSLDNMLEGVQIIGFDWKYIYVNDAMAKHGKYAKDELIGYTVMEKYPGIEETGIFKIYQQCYTERVSIHLENEFTFPDKTSGWFELSFQPVPEGIFILSVDITERKKAEQLLRDERDKLARISATAPGLIYSLRMAPDGSFSFPYASKSIDAILGFHHEEVLHDAQKIINLCHPEAFNRINGSILKSAREMKPWQEEFRYIHPVKGELWLEGNSIPMADPDGSVTWHGVITDVSSRKAAELKIVTNEKRFRKLVENGDEGFAILNGEGHPLYISSSIERVLGFTETEASKLCLFSQTHPDDLGELKKTFKRALQNPGVPCTCPHSRILHKDGSWHWLEQTLTNMMNDPDIGGIVDNFRDVTARVNSKMALIASEEQYRTLIEQASDGIFIADSSGMLIMVNSSGCKMCGFSFEELKQLTIYDLIEPASLAGKPIGRSELMNPAGGRIERKIICKNGSVLDVEISAKFLSDKRLIAFVRDITERIAAGNAIRESEEKYRVLVEEASEGIFITDPAGRFITVNNSACKITQYTEQELLTMNIYDFFVAEDIAQNPLQFDLLREGKTVVSERPLRRKDGQLSFIEITSKLLTDGRLLSIVRDVSERKRVQEALIMSEEKYRSLVEQASDGIIIATSNGRFSVVNGSACTMSGYSEEELKTFTIYDLLDPESLVSHPFKFEEMMLPQGARSERKFVRKDGTMLDIEISAKFLSDKRFIAFVRDISERKAAEQSIRLSNERYNLVSKATHDAIWEFDILTGATTRTGDGFKSLFGYENDWDSGDANSGLFMSHIHPEDLPNVINSIKNVYDTPDAHYWEQEYRFLKAGGEYAYVYDRAYIIRDEQGVAVRMIGATQDVSRLKENEINLRKLNGHLEKQTKALTVINAELEQFAYVASHDLQEPLRMVTSFLTLIEQKYGDVIDDNGRKYISFAVDGAKRMRQIILDLLEFSRVGRNTGEMERIDLGELLQKVQLLFGKRIEKKHAVLHIGSMPVIYSYETPLQQVFQNLIGNALKYSRDNIPVKINVEVKETAEHWQFSVADNGIGIAAAYFDKIFIIFQRLHNKNEFSGTGIGLAITKKIVENLGGEIWVESTINRGSTFFFTIKKTAPVVSDTPAT